MSLSRTKKTPQLLGEEALYEYAVKALGRRMRTVAELKRLMRSRVEHDEGGEARMSAVILRLKERGYLNDLQYAADYTRLRQENEKFGKRRVQQELYRKGVHPELIGHTLDAAYEPVNEEALALAHLERKHVKPPVKEKETARIVRLLVRAGFSTGVIFKVLKSWNTGDEALAELDTLDSEENAGPE